MAGVPVMPPVSAVGYRSAVPSVRVAPSRSFVAVMSRMSAVVVHTPREYSATTSLV